MCHRQQSGDSTMERMAALYAYNKAWRAAHGKVDIPVPSMSQFLDELVVSFLEDRKAVTVHRLSSKLRALLAACHWTLGFRFVIYEVTVDTSQDLLALVPFYATPSPAQWRVSTIRASPWCE